MRTIIITVKEKDNGQNANIDVKHSKYGNDSEIELVVVNLLDDYLYEKVNEITESEKELKHKLVKNREECSIN